MHRYEENKKRLETRKMPKEKERKKHKKEDSFPAHPSYRLCGHVHHCYEPADFGIQNDLAIPGPCG